MTKLKQKFAQNENLSMFLFNKKTRNIIKYMWSFMAVLIVFSMIFAYSGFTSLSQPTATQQQMDIPPEVQAQLDLQKSGITTEGGKVSTPEEQAILDAINNGSLNIDPSQEGSEQTPSNTSGQDPSNTSGQDPVTSGDGTDTPATPPVQELKLEI